MGFERKATRFSPVVYDEFWQAVMRYTYRLQIYIYCRQNRAQGTTLNVLRYGEVLQTAKRGYMNT